MRRTMLAVLIGLAVAGPAGASRLVGDDTMADYRKWSEAQKVAYLSGFTGLARLMGMECRTVVTVGELAAALDYRTFEGVTPVSEAIFRILRGYGCEIRETSKPGA